MDQLTDFLRQMPKIELHVHLESTMPGWLLERFAVRQGRVLPRTPEELYHCSAEDLSDFLGFLDRICSYVGTTADLAEAAEHFSAACREENILYAEAILNPTHWPQFSLSDIISAVTEGFDRGEAAGGADCRFMLSLSRNQTAEEADALVSAMERCRTPRLAGLSIDGNEALSGRTGDRFAPAFARARELGFGLTAHAGESSGPEGVLDALECLKVDRIDHGVRAAEDPALLERLAAQRVPLNVCLSSNLALLYRDPREHPLRQLLDVGAAVTLSRDDPMFLGALTLTEELRRAAVFARMSEAELLRCQETAVDAAFCGEETKTALRAALEAFRSRS